MDVSLFFKVASLTQGGTGQSYHSLITRATILKDMGKNWLVPKHNKTQNHIHNYTDPS